MHNYEQNNIYNESLVSMLTQKPYKYFFTISFKNTTINHDAELSKFIMITQSHLLGQHNKPYDLQMFIVRETKKRIHYHILIEDHGRLSLERLGVAIIHATAKCKNVQTLEENDLNELITNFSKIEPRRRSRLPLNIIEIESHNDLTRIAWYLSKEINSTLNLINYQFYSHKAVGKVNTFS